MSPFRFTRPDISRGSMWQNAYQRGIANCEFRIANFSHRGPTIAIRNSQFEIRNSQFFRGWAHRKKADRQWSGCRSALWFSSRSSFETTWLSPSFVRLPCGACDDGASYACCWLPYCRQSWPAESPQPASPLIPVSYCQSMLRTPKSRTHPGSLPLSKYFSSLVPPFKLFV